MKATNIVLHGLNGLLVFVLVQLLLRLSPRVVLSPKTRYITSLTLCCAWLLSPINLTSVLYVVQRMESLANLFVLAGLIGYVHSRDALNARQASALWPIAWMTIPAALGTLAKETAILLPLYALCIEVFVFRFRVSGAPRVDRRLFWAFTVVLGIPFAIGCAWVAPGILASDTWATRDFTLETRLLSEPRVVLSYAAWTLFPIERGLSFYHDNFVASTGLLSPWTTIASLIILVALICTAGLIRRRLPLTSLGIALFFACHTLTGTVLPLELVYEHRNYFASLGVLLAAMDICIAATVSLRGKAAALPVMAAWVLIIHAAVLTRSTSDAWGSPLGLARELARRAPDSPRAMYELGRAYIIASRYDRTSPYIPDAIHALELAADLPASSILPEQALIFLNSRTGDAIPQKWWQAMRKKLARRPATVQDESALITLSTCRASGSCQFPIEPLDELFRTGLDHPAPTARLYFAYGQFATGTLHKPDLGLSMTRAAVRQAPNEPVYREALIRSLTDRGNAAEATAELELLRSQNVQGRLDRDIAALDRAIAPSHTSTSHTDP